MHSDWTTIPLGELTENLDGVRIPVREADRKPGPYPYYGASGIVDWVDGYLFDGEHLLIAEDGENLRTRKTPIAFIARGQFWVNNHAHIVQGNDRADTRFLMYALSQADVSAYLTGSTMPKLTQGNLNRIPIRCPSLVEQRAIANVLGTLDDKIELNRQMNETLEAMARAVFRSWFVDFELVRAKAEGRKPDGLDAATAKLFPDTFEDSPLGPVPKGWRVGWAALNDGRNLYLAPTFDHGAAMARNLTDQEREERLNSRDVNRQIPAFVRKARSGFYAQSIDTKPQGTFAAWRAFAQRSRSAETIWLGRLAAIQDDEVARLVLEVPEKRMSSICRTFTQRLLQENRHRLLPGESL